MLPETTVTSSPMSLRERAIAEANASDERDQQHAAKQAAERRQRIVDFAATTAVGIFGEVTHGVVFQLVEVAEGDPYEDDRAVATIGGERFEFEYGSSLRRFLRHLTPCPSPLHPSVEMRSDAISSLYDLGEILRSPEGRYHCLACSRVEDETEERLDSMAAETPEPPDPPLPTRNQALRWAVTAAKQAGELREELEALDRTPQHQAALAVRVQAAAAASRAWSAVARTLQQDCLTYGVGD